MVSGLERFHCIEYMNECDITNANKKQGCHVSSPECWLRLSAACTLTVLGILLPAHQLSFIPTLWFVLVRWDERHAVPLMFVAHSIVICIIAFIYVNGKKRN